MTCQILFFGRIAELTGKNNEYYSGDQITVQSIKDWVLRRYPELSNETFKVAVNKNFIADDIQIADGSEIAFLPPFAGG